MSSIKAYIENRLSLDSFKELFFILFIGFGFGLGMSIFDSYEIYIVGMSLSVGIIVTCFLIYIVPKIAGMLKHEIDDDSVSLKLAKGRDGEKVKLKRKLQLQDISL